MRLKKVDAIMGGTVGGIPHEKDNKMEFRKVELYHPKQRTSQKEIVHLLELAQHQPDFVISGDGGSVLVIDKWCAQHVSNE